MLNTIMLLLLSTSKSYTLNCKWSICHLPLAQLMLGYNSNPILCSPTSLLNRTWFKNVSGHRWPALLSVNMHAQIMEDVPSVHLWLIIYFIFHLFPFLSPAFCWLFLLYSAQWDMVMSKLCNFPLPKTPFPLPSSSWLHIVGITNHSSLTIIFPPW